MRSLISDYVIDATFDTPVYVYSTSCTTYKENTIGTDSVSTDNFVGIPFCQRLIAGTVAEAHLYKKTEKLESNVLISEVLKNGKFKPSNLPVVVSYVIMDANEKKGIEIK